MAATLALARRDLFSYLLSPTGYIIVAIFMLFTAVLYMLMGRLGGGFAEGEAASLRLLFVGGIWVFLIVGPAISMRCFADEYRLGTFESLMTCPVTERQVVLGKFFGALGFLGVMLLPTALYVGLVALYGKPDFGEIACGYLGMLLAGAAFVATGLLFSALTASQVVAYLMTLFFWLILMVATRGLVQLAGQTEAMIGRAENSPAFDRLLEWLVIAQRKLATANPEGPIRDFAVGLIDTANIVYFLSFIIVSLVVTVAVLQARRWR